ncbi:MAG: 50S ribosomal protein L29 [Bacteroidaceae bacterium]|jgi:large subunit ribosomal protein L29|nr:50S ribosomal protein L29 [Bacteroidaceae bacterium]MBQ2045106.1 50S ribosomal protein L29 [Bacteroidaceae bacterium]MBQ2458004.1 50S ribosomal protein L29 [Bacteroidaceae bacterium]MBQ5375130.1 50S ribosomal protein L29 [Bacteroidaceae bacterium]MBQ5740830.1 50S ribosomal protein L29 [Bacteroidaceae bacterium]
MKIAEIKEMTAAELAERIQTEQANYNQMLLNHAVSPLENNSQIKIARRNIARLKTVLRQKELNK